MSVNFTGAWNANLSKSRLFGPPPKAISVKIEHSDPELREEMVVTKADGGEDRVIFKCWTNGKEERGMLNDITIRGGGKWEDEELVIESWIKIGTREMHFFDCWSLSPDGQTLYMDHRKGDLAGQLTIFERAC